MTCYFPNGLLSDKDVPCNSDAKYSHCCRPDDICLDTGYCLGAYDGGPNVMVRPTCNDQTWDSAACPQLCKDVNPTGAAVLHLYNYASPSTYCCGPLNISSGRCNDTTFDSDLPFVLPNGNFITNRTTGTIWPLNLTEPAKAILSTVTAASAFVTVTATPSADARAPAGPSNVTVGTSVGLPLGFLLLASLAALFFERRSHQRAERQWMQERQGVLESYSMKDVKTPLDPYRNNNTVHELQPHTEYIHEL